MASEIKANKISPATGTAFQFGDSGDTFTIPSGTTLDIASGATVTGLPSNSNIIINGAMNVAQRGTSFTGLTNGSNGYTLDRFRFVEQGSPTFACTISQSSTAPTGFANSLKLDITTAQSSLGASDTLQIDTIIEAQNLQHLSYGSSSAKTLTLSFWVKSNKTGTYGIWFYQDDAVRSFSDSYTIDSADTWEHKTISVPADTVGVIDNNNDRGIVVRWGLAAGSNFTSGTTSNSWETDVTANRYPDLSVNIADNTANEWYITGVQLEVGEVATPFEHEFFGNTVAKCQRYYEKSHNLNTYPGVGSFEFSGAYNSRDGTASSVNRYNPVKFGVRKRVFPTMTIYDGANTSGKISTSSGSNGYSAFTSSAGETGAMIYGTGFPSHYGNYFHWVADSEL